MVSFGISENANADCWNLINLLLDSIDHAYLKTDGSYGDLSMEVVDKVEYLKKLRRGNGSIRESVETYLNPMTDEYDGFEYREEPDFGEGWDMSEMSKKEVADFYKKKNDILSRINDLNICKRGHRVVVYDDEVTVHGMNVPVLADCRQIATESGCDSKHERSFDYFVFYLM